MVATILVWIQAKGYLVLAIGAAMIVGGVLFVKNADSIAAAQIEAYYGRKDDPRALEKIREEGARQIPPLFFDPLGTKAKTYQNGGAIFAVCGLFIASLSIYSLFESVFAGP